MSIKNEIQYLLISNIKFWESYPIRIKRFIEYDILFQVNYNISIANLIPKLNKLNKEQIESDIKSDFITNKDNFLERIFNLYVLGTQYDSEDFVKDTAPFNAVFLNYIKGLSRLLNINFVDEIGFFNLEKYYTKYLKQLKIDGTFELIGKENIVAEEVMYILTTFANVPFQNKFKYFANSGYFRSEGFFSFVKNVLGFEKFKANFSKVGFQRYKDEKALKLPHSVIFVSGFTSEEQEQNGAWQNFIDGDDITNFMFYKWESSSNLRVVGTFLRDLPKLLIDYNKYKTEDNPFIVSKTHAKIFGKTLGYIIASNTIFKNQTISLVGFSLVHIYLTI